MGDLQNYYRTSQEAEATTIKGWGALFFVSGCKGFDVSEEMSLQQLPASTSGSQNTQVDF